MTNKDLKEIGEILILSAAALHILNDDLDHWRQLPFFSWESILHYSIPLFFVLMGAIILSISVLRKE